MDLITIKHERGIYTIYVDNKFYCTCDNLAEAALELDELEQKEGNNQCSN